MAAVYLSDLPDHFSPAFLPYIPTLRQKQRATALVSGSYIGKVNITANKHTNLIDVSAQIYRSQRKSESPHRVNIEIGTDVISDAHCSCKAGMGGQCSHTMALVIQLESWKIAGLKDVPAQPACTSIPQKWDKPRGPKIMAEPVSSIVICRPGNTNRKRRPVMPEFLDNRKVEISEVDILRLRAMKNSPISYLVDSPASSNKVDTPAGPQVVGSPLGYHIPLIKKLYQPRDDCIHTCGDISFPKDTIQLQFNITEIMKNEWNHLNLTQEESSEIEKKTRGQSNSDSWFFERKKRITASNFGTIMKRKKDINEVFLKNTFDRGQFSCAATSYGKGNESVAKQMYIKETGNHIHEIGFVVNPNYPFIGATPDAIVCDAGVAGLVEIKCPYSVRDMSISNACNNRNDFFLQRVDDKFTLSKEHQHWYQVQGQLLVTGAPFCDFVTFTRQELYTERIYPDNKTMTDLLNKLSHLYVGHFKPYFSK